MPISHAVLRINHAQASLLVFDSEHLEAHKIKAHSHYTRQHGSSVRSEHEFFGEVCAALMKVDQVLVCGSHASMADFRHYVDKHAPAAARHILGWEPADHETDAQLVALARQFFLRRSRMT